MPPTSVPAVVRSRDQDAVDAVRHLIGMETWLNEQQALMPTLPDEPDLSSRAPFMAALETFWMSPPPVQPATANCSRTRRDEFAERLTTAMTQLATLTGSDGSVPDWARLLALDIVTSHGVLPAHVEAREIMYGESVYAGLLMAVDSRAPDHVVVFSPGRGWEAYTSVTLAHADIERRSRRMLGRRKDLPGVARRYVETDGDPARVTSRRLTGTSFADAMVERMLHMQQDKLEQAWVEFALERSLPERVQRLIDRVGDALQLSDVFDTDAMLAARESKLKEMVSDERMARLPFTIVQAWRTAHDSYLATWRAIAEREASAQLRPVADLEEYTLDHLRALLAAMGVAEDPQSITLTLDRSRDPGSRLESLSALFEGPAPIRLPMMEAAWRNLPPAGPGTFTARGSDGQVISQLDDATLRYLINRLDVGTRYAAHLRTELRDGERGRLRRSHAEKLLAARMRFEAVEARARAVETPPGGLTDRGWRWVQAVLDAPSPSGRALVFRDAVAARQIVYQGNAIRDIVEITLRDGWPYAPAGLVPSIVYYTPDAPDGVAFREFRNRDDAEQLFFRHPTFREYLLDRLPAHVAEVVPNGTARQFKADRRTPWILGKNFPQGYTHTAGPFVSREINGDLFQAGYIAAMDHAITDVGDVTRSTTDAARDTMLDAWHRGPSARIPTHVLYGSILAPFRIPPTLWRTYDAVRSGDYSDAFLTATDAYVGALATHALGSVARQGISSAFRSVPFRVAGGGLATRPMPSPSPAFASAYRADAIELKGRPSLHGMYSIDGKSYVAIGGKLFHAHYDAINESVRLRSGHALDPRHAGPAIQFQRAHWRHANVASLRKASSAPSLPTTSGRREIDMVDDFFIQIEHVFPDALERRVVTNEMYREFNGLLPVRPITPDQRVRIDRAWSLTELHRLDMNHGSLVTPPTFRTIDPSVAPERLWFYGDKPFHKSMLIRATPTTRELPGDDWGALIGEAHGRGVFGVRLSVVPPDAPMPSIAVAGNLSHADRARTFAVELNVRDLLQSNEGGNPAFELLELAGTEHSQFILRPPVGRIVEMRDTHFRVIERLPDFTGDSVPTATE